ncbi:aminopeptidase m1 [Plakobranchus ocellatus]|uniref:Aminopeptidase m1 n=1 Tax=Plakobranchus ocellatus TaxID=259542 RepID=A0AAV4DJX2_9GAST|nr:aminopeptidase m1 [Plakobranchus ocellatus]
MVTMKWWDDLWLNEGFACLLMYIAMDNIYPKWDVVSTVIDRVVVEDKNGGGCHYENGDVGVGKNAAAMVLHDIHDTDNCSGSNDDDEDDDDDDDDDEDGDNDNDDDDDDDHHHHHHNQNN